MLDVYSTMLITPCMISNTHIAVILDRSGSMSSMRNEIIGGFNAFLEEQKKVPGQATMTLVQFDHDIDRLATFKPLAEIEPLSEKTYEPRGCTKLYDAIGLTCTTVKDEVAKAASKPDKVLIVILTDGQENSSQEYTTEQIQSLVEAQQKAGWEFSFIGANQDAILSARGIGIHNAAANLSFAATPAGATNMMASLSSATASYRCAARGASFGYSEKDRDAQNINPSTAGAFSHKAAFSENSSKAGTLGGVARASALNQRQRTKIASNAAKARWSNKSV